MTQRLIADIAFAIQDETLDRRRAQVLVRRVLRLLRDGDQIGNGLTVTSQPSHLEPPAPGASAPADPRAGPRDGGGREANHAPGPGAHG